jgi:hypothetical protein
MGASAVMKYNTAAILGDGGGQHGPSLRGPPNSGELADTPFCECTPLWPSCTWRIAPTSRYLSRGGQDVLVDGLFGGAGGAEMLSVEMQREIQRLIAQMPSAEMQRVVGERCRREGRWREGVGRARGAGGGLGLGMLPGEG